MGCGWSAVPSARSKKAALAAATVESTALSPVAASHPRGGGGGGGGGGGACPVRGRRRRRRWVHTTPVSDDDDADGDDDCGGASPVWVLYTDRNGIVSRLNDGARASLGYSAHEAAGRHFADLLLDGTMKHMHKKYFLQHYEQRRGAQLLTHRQYLRGSLAHHPRTPWFVRTARGVAVRVHVRLFDRRPSCLPHETWRCELRPYRPHPWGARNSSAAGGTAATALLPPLRPRLSATATSPCSSLLLRPSSSARTVGVISVHCSRLVGAGAAAACGADCGADCGAGAFDAGVVDGGVDGSYTALVRLLRKASDALVLGFAPLVVEYTRNTFDEFLFLVNQKWWFRVDVPRVRAVTVLLAVLIAQRFEARCQTFHVQCHARVGVAFGSLKGAQIGDVFELYGRCLKVARFLRQQCPEACVYAQADQLPPNTGRPFEHAALVDGVVTALEMEIPCSSGRRTPARTPVSTTTISLYSMLLASLKPIEDSAILQLLESAAGDTA